MIGTGKTSSAAQVINFKYMKTDERILVISYTQHALNQFLRDLMRVGIPTEAIVRIGSQTKCTPESVTLLLSNQKSPRNRTHQSWDIINKLKSEAEYLEVPIVEDFSRYHQLSQ